MQTTVKVRLPKNLKFEESNLFEPFSEYTLYDLKVLFLEDIFVTYSGLCLSENGLISESHHAYPEKMDDLTIEARNYIKMAIQDPTKLIELSDEETYLVIHHPWSINYWHWLTEAIQRVWLVRDETMNMILLLPIQFMNIDFIQKSLHPFIFKDILYLPDLICAQVRNLCLPQIKSFSDAYYKSDILQIRRFYLDYFRKSLKGPIHNRIYISRRLSRRRKIENEGNIESILESYGFISLCCEDFTFVEQINLFSHANYLVSIHGAGLTNMLFMKEGGSILELHKRKTNPTDWHSLAYWYLADALNLSYLHQLCDPVNENSGFFEADLKVDETILEENLKIMLNL